MLLLEVGKNYGVNSFGAINDALNSGGRVALSLRGNPVGHTVAVKGAYRETIRHLNGRISENFYYRIMDPGYAAFSSLPVKNIPSGSKFFIIQP